MTERTTLPNQPLTGEDTPFLSAKPPLDSDSVVAQALSRHEYLIANTRDRLDAVAEQDSYKAKELMLLQAIHEELVSNRTTALQFFWNAVLQTVGVVIGFLFGLFSIFGWHAQWIANYTSKQANRLALLSICLSSVSNSTIGPCAEILERASDTLGSFAVDNFGPSALSASPSWPWPNNSDSGPTVLLIFICVPTGAALLASLASWRIYREKNQVAQQGP